MNIFKYSLLYEESPNLVIIFILLSAVIISSRFVKINMIIAGLSVVFLMLVLFYRYPVSKLECYDDIKNNKIYSACSGPIIEIQGINDDKDENYHIRTFLSPTDVHIQYSPISGEVIDQKYHFGKRKPAFLKSADKNEQLQTTIRSSIIGDVIVEQLTGFIVPVISSDVKSGDKVCVGQKIGMMKIGSQCHVTIPKYTKNGRQIKLLVKKGDHPYGGKTPIAEF